MSYIIDAVPIRAAGPHRDELDAVIVLVGCGGTGAFLVESIARLPGRDQLHGQLVGVIASPITTLVRGLASMISGVAIQLKQIEEQGLVGGEAAQTTDHRPQTTEAEASEAPGDPVAEAEAAEGAEEETQEQQDESGEQDEQQEQQEEQTSEDTPSEGETESEEG